MCLRLRQFKSRYVKNPQGVPNIHSYSNFSTNSERSLYRPGLTSTPMIPYQKREPTLRLQFLPHFYLCQYAPFNFSIIVQLMYSICLSPSPITSLGLKMLSQPFMQNPLMSSFFPTKSPQVSCRFVYRLFQEILLLTSYGSELQIMNLIKLQLSRKFFFTYNAVPLFVSFLKHGLDYNINLHSCVLFSLSLCEDSYEYLN